MTILDEVLKRDKQFALGDVGPTVKLIQQALQHDGQQLVDDGEFFTITEGAVKRFQATHKLSPLGFVGTKTAVALDDVLGLAIHGTSDKPIIVPSTLKSSPWVSRMRSITGTKEVPGSANSPIIMAWRGDIGKAFPQTAKYCATYTGDSIPWCGFGLGWCMAVSGILPPFGSDATDKFMWADAWARWGQRLIQPVVGCVMVFTRAGGGHVSMLERLSGNTAYIRGCNQSDMVNVVTKSMSQFTAAVWPPGFDIVRDIQGDVSNAVHSGSEA